jgi:hypothetical protein
MGMYKDAPAAMRRLLAVPHADSQGRAAACRFSIDRARSQRDGSVAEARVGGSSSEILTVLLTFLASADPEGVESLLRPEQRSLPASGATAAGSTLTTKRPLTLHSIASAMDPRPAGHNDGESPTGVDRLGPGSQTS